MAPLGLRDAVPADFARILAMNDAEVAQTSGMDAARLGELHALADVVDRIVVDAAFSGRGIGGALYRELFAWARARAIPQVACEYNIEPPNPASAAFHARFGFREIGQQRVAGGTKLVSLQAADVPALPPLTHRQ